MLRATELSILLAAFCCLIAPALCTCPAGSVQSPISGLCYVYVKETRSWYDAENDCIQREGHLASSTNGFVNSILRNMDGGCADGLWLGGSVGLTSADSWSWSDGSRFKYTNWATSKQFLSSLSMGWHLYCSFATSSFFATAGNFATSKRADRYH